ncbi:MAG TPA: glycosyltransferase family 4 protein [Marmoricola sp.]|nr:glycosyltransferase family 4 protein [Marmoricola sp.]
MKIGLITPPWVPVPPPAYGGLEAVVDRLARGLADAGHDVLLAAPGNSDCPVPCVPGLPEAHPDAGIIAETNREMRHLVGAYAGLGDRDVIHDHSIAGPLYRHRPSGVPVVVTNHGPFDDDTNVLFGAMQQDTTIVAISESQAASARGVRIDRVVHHGMDVDQVPVGNGSGGYALFLGRMSPDKGAHEAIGIARAAGVPLRLAAKMREEAEHEYFDHEIAPLLGAEVEYVGEVDEDDKYQLLGEAVAMLNPIQWAEPFGLVMIEALACGTPVVTTSPGSVPEIVEDGRTGYIRDDPDELAAVLAKAAQLDRGACREEAEKRFTTRRMVQDHVRLYEDLISRR